MFQSRITFRGNLMGELEELFSERIDSDGKIIDVLVDDEQEDDED